MSTLKKVFFALLVIAFSGSSNAALTTVDGLDVSFTYDDSMLGLFGTPTVSGDSLIFAPTTFTASSSNSSPYDFVNQTFAVTINSLYGSTISKTSLDESGTYIKLGGSADVAASGSLTTWDVTNDLHSSSNITPTMPFATTAFPNPVGTWEANASKAFTNSFSVIANINDILGTQKLQANDYALINKLGMTLTATVVPLPQAVWLFGAGLLGLLKVSKRKNLL